MDSYQEIILSYLKNTNNPIILDVGCYLLEDSQKFAERFTNGNIFSFECDPRNIAEILNKDKLSNITVIESAISNYDGESEFWQSDKIHNNNDYWLSGSIKPPTGHLLEYPVSFSNSPIKVPCQKLDTWYKNTINGKTIELIWCDVNGGEKEFLEGAIQTLQNTNLLWIECFEKELYQNQVSCEWINNFLLKYNFKYIYTYGHNKLYIKNNV